MSRTRSKPLVMRLSSNRACHDRQPLPEVACRCCHEHARDRRFVLSIKSKCLNHVVPLGERHWRASPRRRAAPRTRHVLHGVADDDGAERQTATLQARQQLCLFRLELGVRKDAAMM